MCPSCRRLLRIPAAGDLIPPLHAPVRDGRVEERVPAAVDHDADPSGDGEIRRRRKRKRSHRNESHGWESEGRRRKSSGTETRQMQWMLAGGCALLLAILGAVFFAMRGHPEPVATSSPAVADAGSSEQAATAPVVRRSEFQFAADAEPVARAFLEATTVDALLETVDQPDIVAQRILSIHPDGTIDAPGLSDFNLTRQIEYHGPYGVLYVRTQDFGVRRMALREYPDGLKVDWESWAGWSQTPWDDFMATRPTDPRAFRVMIRPVDYYNFDFADDRVWQSYRLDSPDGGHTMHGYVERDSLADERIRSSLERQERPMLLELSFPENPQGRGQVVIHRQLADHWIDPERLEQP